MKPPSGGPITGPISAGMVSQASEEISSFFGTLRRITRRPTGTIIAPPRPCTTRKATNSGRLFDVPHSIEPKVNTAMAAMNTVRAPYLSATQPLIGTNTARLRR